MAALLGISGCAVSSSRPVYPDDWPALESSAAGRDCPNLSGTYRAVSEEAAPLVYPRGRAPQDKFFIPLGPPHPVPPLGLRLLPWHLAGQFDEESATWLSLENYAALADRVSDAGWVRVREQPDGSIAISAGLDDETLLRVALTRESQGIWTYKPQVYKCNDGGLVVYGAFPPPPVENPRGQPFAVGAICTFYPAADGSLVMLEEAYTGVDQGTMSFSKWWRWLPVEARGPVISP
jgi:hypothetical protein